MSLGNLEAADREHQAPPDLLAYATQIINDHTPYWREDGWNTKWVCSTCEARLDDAEAATHTAYELWTRGVLHT